MTNKVLYRLPGLSNLFENTKILCLGVDVWILYSFSQEFEEEWFNSGIIFKKVRAFKKHGEYYSSLSGEHEGAYDHVIEIFNSEWLKQLREMVDYTTRHDILRHFALYLDSIGMFDFCCEDFEVLPIRSGRLNLKDYSIDEKLGFTHNG